MIILGIDPALAITGYGAVFLKKKDLSVIEAGIISTSPKLALPERLDRIYLAITKLMSDIKPEVIILEKLYSHYRHPATAYVLGHARGVICLAASEKNIPLAEYSATRIKKSIVGKGLAPKYQVQRAVVSILNLNTLPKYSDVTDALALAIAHSYIVRTRI